MNVFRKDKAGLSLPTGTKVPNHIALILDGNRRWARSRGLPTLQGHKAGFENALAIAEKSRDWGVHTMSVWGFSTENWDRSEEEIQYLMTLYRRFVDEIKKRAKREGIRFVHLGRKDRFPTDLMKHISGAEEETRQYTKHVLNVCLDYGGQDEIVRAVAAIVKKGIPADRITPDVISQYLDTHDQPYPNVDLLIRTSGEQRTSGFLLWQSHYAEMYWEPEHLPDFDLARLREAILDYSRRRRRFGGNDSEEHMKFNPKVLADLELAWHQELANGSNRERLRDLMAKYAKELYGFSKDLAKEAGLAMANAALHGRDEEWDKAKQSLKGLYGIVKRALKFAFEPETIADLEILLWRNGRNEQELKTLFAEKFRISVLQASKSAHLASLANIEISKQNWKQAHWYLQRCYEAIKERVA